MKRYVLFYLFLPFFLMQPLEVRAWDCFDYFDCELPFERPTMSFNVRVAYFHPESKRVREIYEDGWADYQLEVAAQWGQHWQLWSGISGFARRGETKCFEDSTTLSLIPLSLGVRYLTAEWCCTQFYLGAGICYSWLNIHDHSPYVHEYTHKQAFGGLVQVGAYYYISECFFINAFLDYLSQHFHFDNDDDCYSRYSSYDRYVERVDLNMSGYKAGLGLGYVF